MEDLVDVGVQTGLAALDTHGKIKRVSTIKAKPKKKVIPEVRVFIVHAAESTDGKHHVHWGTNLNKTNKPFTDWSEALMWGFKKANDLKLPPNRIIVSGPRKKKLEPEKVGIFTRIVAAVSKASKDAQPYIKEGIKAGKKMGSKVDRWLTGQGAPRKRKKASKKGLFVGKSGCARYVSRKQFQGSKAVKPKHKMRC